MAACFSRSVPAATKCCCVKRSRPRTSDTANWASLIAAGPYFLALLSGARHLVSCCVAQQFDSNYSVDLPRGPSVVAIYVSQLESLTLLTADVSRIKQQKTFFFS